MLAIYTRLSVEDNTSNSIQNQIREGKSFAEENHFQFKLYDEGMGVSGGADISSRPVLEDLMNDISKGIIKKVWVRDQNRLERNQLTFHLFVDHVVKNNVEIYIADKLVDYSDPDTFFKTSLDSLFHTQRRITQGVKTKRAIRDNLKEGKTRGGIMAYGFSKDSNKFVIIDEFESQVIKEIYDLCLEGKGTRAIATILNEKNIPTRYNKMGDGTLKIKNKYTKKIKVINKSDIKWAQNTIRSILRNPIYKGDKYLGKGKERELFKYPIIIDEKKWQQVQEKLKSNRILTGKKVEHKYLLKGVLECGVCNSNYYGKINKNTNIYMCSSKRTSKNNCGNRGINISAIEAYIWGRLFKEKGVKKALIEHLSNKDKDNKISDLKHDLLKYSKELKRRTEEKKRAIRLAIQGKIEEDDIEPEIARIDGIIQDIEIKSKNLKAQLREFETVEEKEKEIHNDLNNLKNISHNTKRDVINKYISRIYIYYKEPIYILKVHYKFHFEESHILPKDYKIGIIMGERKAYPLKKNINIELELNKIYKKIQKAFEVVD